MATLSKANIFVAGIAASVMVWSSATFAVASRPYVDPNPKFFDAHPIWGTIIALYVGLAGLSVFPMVRRPFIGWYRSQTWLVHAEALPGPHPAYIQRRSMTSGRWRPARGRYDWTISR